VSCCSACSFHLARSGNAIKDSDTLNPLLEEQEYERLEEDTITLNQFEEVLHQEERKRVCSLQDYAALSQAEIDNKVEEIEEARTHFSGEEIWRVFSLIKTPALSVWFVFTVTIGLFPSITVLFESEQACNDVSNRFFNDLWTPLFFLIFNLFDFIGRWSASKVTFACLNARNIWVPVVCRLVFFPLFLLCRIVDSQLPTVFISDAWPIMFMIVFSLTNGYLSSLCMMLGPSLTDPKDSMLAGNIMVFCLTVGLFSGACLSFLSLMISQGSI
jgi:solute carrier family 29 (equilibrative nucleoside transporter), member 1/2/3